MPVFMWLMMLRDAVWAVKWGYNTQKEREEAGAISRIQLIDLPDFSKQLK